MWWWIAAHVIMTVAFLCFVNVRFVGDARDNRMIEEKRMLK